MKDLIDHLFIDHCVQSSVLPEFISFLIGKKKIIRIVLDRTNKPFNYKLFERQGYVVSEISIFSEYTNNSFAILQRNRENIKSPNYQEVVMYSISRDEKQLKIFEKAEVEGDTELAGILLGYPECCVKNSEKISSYGELWANYYLLDYNNNQVACHLNNRFPIAWGGISPIGELFPCSLSCKHAAGYAQDMMANLTRFGFSKIVNLCKEHGLRTVFLNQVTGNISISPKVGYSAIQFQ